MATPYLQMWVEEVPSTGPRPHSNDPLQVLVAPSDNRRVEGGEGRLDLRTTSPRGLTRIPPLR